MSEQIAELVKGGEQRFLITFHHNKDGLALSVKAIPEVEEYFQRLAMGVKVSPTSYGRLWVEEKGGNPLQAWCVDQDFKDVGGTGQYPYTLSLSKLGQGLIEPGVDDRGRAIGTGVDRANLSFLKLVGIGGGNGLTIGIKGVYSVPMLRKMRDHIAGAIRCFYVDYLQPADLSISISTQEVRF